MSLANRKFPQAEAQQTTEVTEEAAAMERPLGVWGKIKEDVACVLQRDPAARNRLEVVLTYPGVHAIVLHRWANALWRHDWRFSARFLSYIARVWTCIDIHPGAAIGRRFFIDHGSGVVIGETAEVGDDVTLYHGVTLGGTSWSKGKRHPTLGRGVVVGAGAKVLGPLTIGDYSKVGANSVVIKDVPPRRTVVGIPAKAVRNDNKVTGLNPYGIDLNHHLIPDPLAAAIGCLVERIQELEKAVGLEEDEKERERRRCGACDGTNVCRHENSTRQVGDLS